MGNSNKKKHPLLQKDYILAVLSGGLFITINFALFTLSPLYMLHVGYSEFAAGLQNTLYALFCVVFRFYFAPLADIKGRKAMMLLGTLSFVLGTTFFYLSMGSLLLIILARLSMGVGMASFLSAMSCYISELVPSESRGMAIGIQRALYSLGLMLGPVGALAIVKSQYGYKGMFLALIGVSICMSFLILLLRDTYKPSETKVKLKKIIYEYQELLENRNLARIFGLILMVCIIYGAILSFVAIYLSGFPAISNVGLFFTFFSTGGLMGNVVGGFSANRFAPARAATVCAGLLALATALLYLIPHHPMLMLVLCSLLGGFGFSATTTISINWLIASVPEKTRGTALGVQENAMDGGFAIGSFVFGLLTLFATHQVIFLILGISGIILPVLMNRSGLRPSSSKKEENANATSYHD
ncbi:MFS transporter [Clostridia bacterium]|nr:MFS transporter [Clostridia bacterium]